jgi:hypothetical protein
MSDKQAPIDGLSLLELHQRWSVARGEKERLDFEIDERRQIAAGLRTARRLDQEIEHLTEAMCSAVPSTVDEIAVLLDLALEQDGCVDPAFELDRRLELRAVISAVRRLAPKVPFYSLRDKGGPDV